MALLEPMVSTSSADVAQLASRTLDSDAARASATRTPTMASGPIRCSWRSWAFGAGVVAIGGASSPRPSLSTVERGCRRPPPPLRPSSTPPSRSPTFRRRRRRPPRRQMRTQRRLKGPIEAPSSRRPFRCSGRRFARTRRWAPRTFASPSRPPSTAIRPSARGARRGGEGAPEPPRSRDPRRLRAVHPRGPDRPDPLRR